MSSLSSPAPPPASVAAPTTGTPTCVVSNYGAQTWLQPATVTPFSALSALPGGIITVDRTNTRQPFLGVGSALNGDSAYALMNYLTQAQRTALLTQYYGADGHSFVRICLGDSDYSPDSPNYTTYDDVANDTSLSNFSILKDIHDVIPILQEIKVINPRVKIVSSVWSYPAWVKNGGVLEGGSLNASASNLAFCASYVVAALQAFLSYGINIDYVSPLNEPQTNSSTYPSGNFADTDSNNYVKNYLGPAIDNAGLSTGILVGDNVDFVSSAATISTAFSDLNTLKYTKGCASHSYGFNASTGAPQPATAIGKIMRSFYPQKLFLLTEVNAHVTDSFSNNGVPDPLSKFMNALVGSVRNYASGFMFWNMALPPTGQGPAFIASGYSITAMALATIATDGSGTVTPQLNYRVLAHIGRYVKPGAFACFCTGEENSVLGQGVEAIAFANPDGTTVIFGWNDSTSVQLATVMDGPSAQAFVVTLNPNDFFTAVYGTPQATAGFTPPNPPTALTSNGTGGVANLAWTAPNVIGSTALAGYKIRRSNSSGTENAIVGITKPTATSFVDNSAAVGPTLYYTVEAFGGGGSSVGNPETSVVLSPSAPSVTIPLVSVGSGVVNTSASITGKGYATTTVNVLRGTASNAESGTPIGQATLSATPTTTNTFTASYSDTTAVNGTQYFYKYQILTTGPTAVSAEVSGTPSTTFLNESFVAATGTDIVSLPASVGGSWAYTSASTGSFLIDNNANAIYPSSTNVLAINSVTPPAADYSVTGVFAFASTITGDNIAVGIRATQDGQNGYFVVYDQAGDFRLIKIVSGAVTTLATYSISAFTSGTITAKVAAVGTKLTATIGGTVQTPVTDSAISAANHPAIRSITTTAQTAATGVHLQSIVGNQEFSSTIPIVTTPSVGVGNNVVNLSASITDNGFATTQVNVLRGTTTGGESATPIGQAALSPTPTATNTFAASYSDTTAVNGTQYFYEYQVINGGGNVTSAEVSATPSPIFLNQSFANLPAGTGLTSTTPAQGGTWVVPSGYSGTQLKVDANSTSGAIYNAATSSHAYNNVTAPSANYSVTGVFEFLSTITGDAIGVCVRSTTDGQTYYQIKWNQATSQFQLIRNFGGTSATLMSYNATFTSGTQTATIGASGTVSPVVLSVTINGVAQADYYDTSSSIITAAGFPAIRSLPTSAQTATTGIHIQSIQASQLSNAVSDSSNSQISDSSGSSIQGTS